MKKSKLTKKAVEDLYTTMNIEIVEDAAADGNVYCHFINIKYYPDEDSDSLETLASATIYAFQDYEFNMRDDADAISGDLYWIMNSLIDKFNVKSYDKVCILDSFDFFNADVTAGARIYLLKTKVMPYLQDIGVKWLGFCNAAVLFTDKPSEQNSIDKKLESFPGILPFVDKGTNWKDTVRCVNSTLFRYHEWDDEIANEDYLNLKLYEEENNLKLPDNFEDLYYAYFSNEAQTYTQKELTLIKQVYEFRKSMYYRRTNEEFIMTSEAKKVMDDTRKIIDTFNNIDDMFDSCEKSAAAYMESAIRRNLSNQTDNLISLFVSSMKKFIDYLDQQWLPHYIPEYREIWKEQFCSFVYDYNLGYRLCYNLRDFDQHPHGHYGKSLLNEIEDTEDCDGGANEDGILDLNALFIDEKFKRKMNKDYAKLKQNPYLLPYMRDCLIELRGLYILPLEKFYLKNRESLQEDYQYLLHYDLTEYLYKVIDDRDLSRVGTDIDFDTACTRDIEAFLNRLKYLGVINSDEIETFKHVASDYYYYE